MSTTQHTGHYNLPAFGDNPNDRPSWRGDFTDAMTKIDNQMYANATNITTATAAANNATTAAGEAKKAAEAATSLAQANKNDIADLDGYFGKLGVTSESTAQQLMDTINGKAEDTELTSLKGAVSSLSSTVNTKANTSDVYTKGQSDTTFTKQGGYPGTAQQLDKRIQALEAKPQGQLPICLCIGDSYANSSSTVTPDGTNATKWPTQLRNIIGGEYQVKNYSVTGAGFNVSGNTFTDQINNAYSASAIDNDNVAIIIIGGGRNDIGTTPQMESYADATFSNARTKFPKARIVSVPMLWHNVGMDMYGRQKAAGVAEAAAANGVENVDWAWTWNIGNDSNFPSGDVHPNADGAKVIASYMAAAIRGTYTGRYEAATVAGPSGKIFSNVVASGGMIFATLWGDDSSTNAQLKAGITFPKWARSAGGSSPNTLRTWGAGLTNSGTAISGWLLTDTTSVTGAPRISYFGDIAGGNNGCFVCYPW
ncbi:MAG: GDSL-like Lipase/Acylhydrolase family protein [Bacteriophage sp.]|nr:MAG: GDSL-like Lipase/Acylhydrolase family protein [Bacteriophage sp.]